MKKIFKKNQVIITALAIMIAVAGYINYSDNYLGIDKTLEKASTEISDEVQETAETDGIVEDIESLDYDLTDESALLEENAAAGGLDTSESSQDASAETPGEAVLTGSSNFAAQARINREQVRSANKETLMEIINNETIGDDKKQEAIASMVEMTNLAEQEEAAELLLEAKGFTDVVVNLTSNSADIIVPGKYMEDDKRAQIEDIVKRKTSVPVENIVITPLEEGNPETE
ncbi:MAG: SpoIIIAH-like family protein [Blautia sp.]